MDTKTGEAIVKALRNDSVYTKLDEERKVDKTKEYLLGFEVKINGYNGELFSNYEAVEDNNDGTATMTPINAVTDLLARLNICGIPIIYEYYGDVMFQKTITVDFLRHFRVKNKGQAEQYMIEENHPPIISRETFDAVQAEKAKRAIKFSNYKGDRQKYTNKYPFSGKVFCGDCGNTYRRRAWNSNNKSKKNVWQCKTYIQKGKDACSAKAVDEEMLKNAFIKVFNQLYENREGFTKTMAENIEKVLLSKPSDKGIEVLDGKINESKTELKRLIRFQTTNGMDDEVYREEYKRVSGELEAFRDKRAEYDNDSILKESLKGRIDEIIQVLKDRREALIEFDEGIFNTLVEKIEIVSPRHFVFELKSGVRYISIKPS